MLKGELQKLYRSGLSVHEIARKFGVSDSGVQYWMIKYGISRRSISDAIYQKCNPNGDPFQLKKDFSQKDLVLLGLGLGLWWGEGSKTYPATVRLGNTDPALIRMFINFLTDICGFPRERLRFGLQIFSDMDPDLAMDFWRQQLMASKAQFFKVIVTPARSIGTYRNKTLHGVLTVYAGNRNLRQLIDILLNKYADVAQLVERVHGREMLPTEKETFR